MKKLFLALTISTLALGVAAPTFAADKKDKAIPTVLGGTTISTEAAAALLAAAAVLALAAGGSDGVATTTTTP